MLFLAIPDVPAQIIDIHPSYVAATTTNDRAVNQGNFGYCMIADMDGSLTGGIDITQPFYNLIPKHIQKALDDSAQLGVSVLDPSDEAWLAKWQDSFEVVVLRQPEHAELRRHDNSQFVGITPKEGYLGKDRMDILIKGRAPDGHSVSARVNIFIRVDTKGNLRDLLDNYSKMTTYLKQNCPEPKEFWKIDHKTQTTGSSAKITVDYSVTSYGVYIDDTAYLNDEYLPISSVI